RRQLDGDHLQAPEEVLAEPSFLHELRKVAVGGADHAQVEQDRLLSADPLDLVLLQRPEDLRLEIQRQIADLVEEQRPAVRQLELAQLLPVGAGEGAALVAEELALTRLAGMAGRFTATNGLVLRSLRAWMYRASTSFPVPLSLVTSTVTGLAAIFSATCTTARIRGDVPSTIGRPTCVASTSWSRSNSRPARSWASVLRTRAISSGGEKSLVT